MMHSFACFWRYYCSFFFVHVEVAKFSLKPKSESFDHKEQTAWTPARSRLEYRNLWSSKRTIAHATARETNILLLSWRHSASTTVQLRRRSSAWFRMRISSMSLALSPPVLSSSLSPPLTRPNTPYRRILAIA